MFRHSLNVKHIMNSRGLSNLRRPQIETRVEAPIHSNDEIRNIYGISTFLITCACTVLGSVLIDAKLACMMDITNTKIENIKKRIS